jgi:epoxide hydrolase 4
MAPTGLFPAHRERVHTVGMNVKSRFVEVEPGVRLYVAEAGAGPLVVLLHGFPDGWSLWERQLLALAEAGFRAVAVEQRGYRLSDQPRGPRAYRVGRLAEDVKRVIQEMGYDSASVVGHDWGGGVAWCFAMLFPQKLDKLIILTAPHPRRFVDGLRTFQQLRKSWYILLFQLPWLAERVTGAPTGAVNWYRAMRFGGVRYRRIEQPVLVIWGDGDPFLSKQLAQPDRNDVPRGQVVHLRAGHWVMRDQPQRVNELITDFLKEA